MSSSLQRHRYIPLSSGEISGDHGGAGEEGRLELRLGLPGSRSPDRRDGRVGLTLALLPTATKGFGSGSKRGFSDALDVAGKWGVIAGAGGSEIDGGDADNGANDSKDKVGVGIDRGKAPVAKAQVVGWPPIRNFRKTTMATNLSKNKNDADGKQGMDCLYVKVSMDGAPYLRKVDLRTYKSYKDLSSALELMFSCFTIGQCDSHGIPSGEGLSESRLMDLLNGSEYVLTYEDKDGDFMLVGDVPWGMFTDSCRRLRIMKGSDAIGLAPKAMDRCNNRN